MSIPGLNFTAIDFETANRHRGSVCAVGLIKVTNGQVCDIESFLVQNPDGGPFSSFNTRIHGIRATDVRYAPTWEALWPALKAFIGADSLLAHNAPFDRSVWRSACELSAIQPQEPPFYCTLRLARRVLQLPSNRLPLVAEALQIPAFTHHSAADDALACAHIGIELARREGYRKIEDFETKVGAAARGSRTSRGTR